MSWRTFKFFEQEDLKDPDTSQSFDKLQVWPRSGCVGLFLNKAHLLLYPAGYWRNVLRMRQRTDDFWRYPSQQGREWRRKGGW